MQPAPVALGPQADRSIFAGTMVDLTWPEVEESARRGDVVLLPVGIVEAHGPHMDLSPDVYLGYLYSRLLSQRLAAKGIRTVISPPLYWGVSLDIRKYAGTFSVRPETMRALLNDVFASLDSWGFTRTFVINAHGDPTHRATIGQAIRDLGQAPRLRVWDLGELDVRVDGPPFPSPRPDRFPEDYHAGANETACMHLFFPDRVNGELARTLPPQRGWEPMPYYGDPASFELEHDVVAHYEADLETDALKIEAVLAEAARR